MSNQHPTTEPLINMRTGQRRLIRLIDHYRMIAFVARRQYGKTTAFSNIALKKMMRTKDHTVIFGSAKLNLSREIVRKEAATIERGISAITQQLAAGQFELHDQTSGNLLTGLTHDDFAELFEAQRLEFRYYHDRGSYSRTKVVALRPDAVGETGDLMADEVGRINNWRETWEAIEPIVASNPTFRLLLCTTIPPDDTHYSFEQLCPPPGSIFTPRPDGNLYESNTGVTVYRLDADDAYADGIPLYDLKTGKPLTPAQHRAASHDKDAWDRNYGCIFLQGGSAAVSTMILLEAMQRGSEPATLCLFAEDELPDNWHDHFTGGPVGIGGDPATTDGAKSNPFGIVITERVNGLFVARVILSFKSADPAKPKAVLREIALRTKPLAVALDASSERYWCAEVAQDLAAICPVMLVVNSEKTEYLGLSMLYKAYLGHLAVDNLSESVCCLPNHPTVQADFRLVRQYKGGFDNKLDSATGRHGDLFDGFKLSLHALLNGNGICEATAVDIRSSTYQPQSIHGSRMILNSDDLPDDDIPTTYIHGA